MDIVVLPRTRLVSALFAVGFLGCGPPPRYSVFPVDEVPASLREADWTLLATDAEGDGQRDGRGDAASFAFFYDAVGDTLWFRWELHDGFDRHTPAVSVSFDTDADQGTGRPWYGSNEGFHFDQVASVGPVEETTAGMRGYNGITDTTGVRTLDWMNRQSGGLILYVDSANLAYYLGVPRADVSPDARRFRVIGSVGSEARWNDDVGESGFATIDLTAGGSR